MSQLIITQEVISQALKHALDNQSCDGIGIRFPSRAGQHSFQTIAPLVCMLRDLGEAPEFRPGIWTLAVAEMIIGKYIIDQLGLLSDVRNEFIIMCKDRKIDVCSLVS